jgi:hypothetical protein
MFKGELIITRRYGLSTVAPLTWRERLLVIWSALRGKRRHV